MVRHSRRWGMLALALGFAGCYAEFHAGAGPRPEAEPAEGESGGEAAAGEATQVAEAEPETQGDGSDEAEPEEEPAETNDRQLTHVGSTEPGEDAEQPSDADPPTTGTLEIVCQFSDAWIAVVPRRIYRPNDEFLMQALIGFTEDASFWAGQPTWQRYQAHAAERCGVDPLRKELQPGAYVVLVGWAGRFEAHGGYSHNGRIERVVVRAGDVIQKTYLTGMLNHDWSCVSCPTLAVRRDGRTVEIGQVLVDRYSARREGTDVRRAEVDVRGGRITLTLIEREPEVSRVDAVELLVGGRALPPAEGTPAELAAIDGVRYSLTMGESIEIAFDAPGWEDGSVEAEIRVTGHYEPIGPLL